MTWHPTAPIGTISVKSNKLILQDNITYIENTMGNISNPTKDHFWNVGANEDGHHRFVNMPQQTVFPTPTTGMDGIIYLKQASADATNIEGFYTNAQGRYQFIPCILEGTVVVGSSMALLVAVPKNVYGEIFMFTTLNGSLSGQSGFFKSNATIAEAWALTYHIQGTSNTKAALKFGNGSDASLLNLQVRSDDASSDQTWNYRITYRAITN